MASSCQGGANPGSHVVSLDVVGDGDSSLSSRMKVSALMVFLIPPPEGGFQVLITASPRVEIQAAHPAFVAGVERQGCSFPVLLSERRNGYSLEVLSRARLSFL